MIVSDAVGQRRTNLIVAACANYGLEETKCFLISALRNCPSADIMICCKSVRYDLISFAEQNGIHVFPYSPDYTEGMNVQNERFSHVIEAISSLECTYKSILLTDIRDVIIQKDCFFALGEADELLCAIEDLTIKESRWNMAWLLDMYGHQVAHLMRDLPISCSGTTMGPSRLIIKYLVAMTHELGRQHRWNHLPNDQGVHNYIIWKKWINILLDRDENVVATIGLTASSRVEMRNGLITKDGKEAAIVHQWDRHGHIKQQVLELYSSV